MPIYVLHGFRWCRESSQGIKVYIILNDIDDAAAEYLQQPKTTRAMLQIFHRNYPKVMEHLPSLRFIEQYDPEDMSSAAVSQPYAYVADKVVELSLGGNVDKIISEGPGLSAQGWEAMADLRDTLAPDSKIGWWVVYNGDPERIYPGDNEESGMSEIEEEEVEEGADTPRQSQQKEGREIYREEQSSKRHAKQSTETLDLPNRSRSDSKSSNPSSSRSSLTKRFFKKKSLG